MADPRNLKELQREHLPAPPSQHTVPRGEAAEQSGWRNYVRDLILGYNDGLVSVYAAVAGISGAAAASHFTNRQVLTAGVAFGIAGALSMGLGEYLSTKSQTEYYASEADRERAHIRKYPALERQEVEEMLAEKGYPAELVPRIVEHVTTDEDRFVEFMMREEFGVGKESERSPWIAMMFVMLAFVLGALFPVLPFLLPSLATALIVATGVSLVGLFAAGAVKSSVSGLSAVKGGLEMIAFGAVAGAITYGVGLLFGLATA